MDTPQISRSGRVLKKSAKVKEMEDFDINELDAQGKPSKKTKTMEDFDEFDDKRVAPIKIPKISLNVQKGGQKRMNDMPSSAGKQIFKPTFHNALKSKQDIRRNIYNDSSDGSKESDSTSVSSESSSSSPTSSDASDDEDPYNTEFQNNRKNLNLGMQSLSVRQDKVIVEQNQQRYESPAYLEPSSGMSSDDSEDGASDSALVIAEDSDESANYTPRGQRGGPKKKVGKKDPSYAPRQGGGRKKAPAKNTETSAAKKKKPAPKSKPLSAYMLWCSENRKKIIAASAGKIGFGTVNKAMGEAWQALPEKEKMAWRRKAKRLAMKTTGNVITTGISNAAQNKTVSRTAASISDELLKGLTENTGFLSTAPIDAAAHLKLLGDSLTVIGQRLIEHEIVAAQLRMVVDAETYFSGQLAVSGIYSVLLDTLLCAIGPLLCLTTEITGLEHIPTDVLKKTLDHIAYFMPGL